MISMSGIFSVTFSVIFAYVADVTQEHERITAYGLVRYAECGKKRSDYDLHIELVFWCTDCFLVNVMRLIEKRVNIKHQGTVVEFGKYKLDFSVSYRLLCAHRNRVRI